MTQIRPNEKVLAGAILGALGWGVTGAVIGGIVGAILDELARRR